MFEIKNDLTQKDKAEFYRIIFPSMIEILFIQCFSFVDTMMVGHIPNSTSAVAALSLCASPINLTICVIAAFFIGTTAAIARNFGANNNEEVRNIAFQTTIISLMLGIIISISTYTFSNQIMKFVCGTSDTFETAAMYYRINTIGYIAQIITINITASFRGIGLTKLPMIYNMTGNAVNVIFNYILIYGKLGLPALNAKGAAIATVLSKIIMLMIALPIWLIKSTPVKPTRNITFKPCESIRRYVIPIGITSAGEQFLLQFGATITAKIISVLPTKDIAASSIYGHIESIAWSTGDACCTASTSLFGRGLGENREDKSKAYLKLISKWAIGFALFEIIVIIFFGKNLIMLFSNDTSIYSETAKIMFIGAISLPFINMHKTVSGALRSAGDSLAPLIASFISLWVFRVLLGFILISVLKKGIYSYRVCINLDQFVRMTAVIIFFFTGHWKKYIYKNQT